MWSGWQRLELTAGIPGGEGGAGPGSSLDGFHPLRDGGLLGTASGWASQAGLWARQAREVEETQEGLPTQLLLCSQAA